MKLDKVSIQSTKLNTDLEKRELDILSRIKLHYSNKLKREIPDIEAREIADNLLHFAKAIYGT